MIKVGDRVHVTGFGWDAKDQSFLIPVHHRWKATVVRINQPLLVVKVDGAQFKDSLLEVYPCQCVRLVKRSNDYANGARRVFAYGKYFKEVIAGSSIACQIFNSRSSQEDVELIELTDSIKKRLKI